MFVFNSIMGSIIFLFRTSTSNPNFFRKSEPIIALFTSAITNVHGKFFLSSMLIVFTIFSYVGIILLFVANSSYFVIGQSFVN